METTLPIGVFLITDSLGGAENVLFQIVKYFDNKNMLVKIYFIKSRTNNDWQKDFSTNVETIYLNNDVRKFYKYIYRQKFYLVFSTHLTVNAFLGILRTFRILRTKHLIARESTEVFSRYKGFKLLKYKILYLCGYRNIDLLICQTKEMKEIILEEAPFLSNRIKIETIYNPFSFPSDEHIYEPADIQGKYIVSAGRLITEKGFSFLIKAFSLIQKDFSDLKLVILGEGNLRESLEKQILNLNLENKVILKGFVNNVYPYFKYAEACVISSIKEGFPNALLQMMSQNTRVVSTLCAGRINEIKGIETCSPGNVVELKDALIKVLTKEITNERFLFDEELRANSIYNFMNKIMIYIQ
jgi:glycosyltransferase involved in cell wall biosynthesis